jgi:hypothetical protein
MDPTSARDTIGSPSSQAQAAHYGGTLIFWGIVLLLAIGMIVIGTTLIVISTRQHRRDFREWRTQLDEDNERLDPGDLDDG